MWKGRKERKDTVFLHALDCNALCYHEMSLSHSCFTSPSPISMLRFFKPFMQITANQLFSHLNGKVWSQMGAKFQKNYISFVFSG